MHGGVDLSLLWVTRLLAIGKSLPCDHPACHEVRLPTVESKQVHPRGAYNLNLPSS